MAAESMAVGIRNAGRIIAAGRRRADGMSPREHAEAAWTPTCGLTLDELEDLIRAERGIPLAEAS